MRGRPLALREVAPLAPAPRIRGEEWCGRPSPVLDRAGHGGEEQGAILVVDSDRRLAEALMEQYRADGYRTALAFSAEHARIGAGRETPAAIVLGALGSDRGAIELLEEIRLADRVASVWERDAPVIVLAAGGRELDMLRAFDAGADDFMTRPARYLELRARTHALLRRARLGRAVPRTMRVGPLQIDLDARCARLRGAPLQLRRLEFELLAHLASDPRRVFAKHELLKAVWDYRSTGSTRTVDSHASRLRRKLASCDAGPWIVNVWGIGYRLR
jgi:DNA-binding response OmpR family regulator